MKIIFLYAGGRRERIEAVRLGNAPTEFFYGAIELARLGHTIDFEEVGKAPRALVTAYNRLLQWATPVRTNGDDIFGVAQLLSRLRGRDCIVATTSSIALALAAWKKVGLVRSPIVGIHCGAFHYPPRGVRRWSTRALLEGTQMALFAQPEANAMRRFFELPDISTVPFGVDTDFWSPGDSANGDYILSVGSDFRRDYETLIAAAEQCLLPVKILTTRPLPATIPSHVSVLQGSWKNPALDDFELRQLYRGARFVVVPLLESIQPSGQSVALQAMACGKPVIITHTTGLWTEHNFNENQEIFLVPEKNPDALAAQMLKLWNDPQQSLKMGKSAREAVLRAGNIRSFANGILECCNRAVAASEPTESLPNK